MLKRFIKKSVLFSIVFIALILIVNSTYNKLVVPHTVLERMDNQFYEYVNDTKILFIGDSHTNRGINPLMINNSFNFASANENYIKNYYKLKTILNLKNFKPEIIIIPIDFHSLSSSRTVSFHNEWYWIRYVDFKELSKFNGCISPTEKKIKAFFPFIGQGLDFLSILVEGKSELIKGHKLTYGNYSNLNDKYDASLRKASFHLAGYAVIDKVLLLYFQKMLDLTEKKKIKTILIKFPITKEYSNATDKYIHDKAAYYNQITDIADSYDNVYILDYQKIYFYNNSLFDNPDHLNSFGAEIFSELINEDVRSIDAENDINAWNL